MAGADLKERIKQSLLRFENDTFYQNAIDLFNTLGYKSPLKVTVGSTTPNSFFEWFDPERKINPEKACVEHWRSIAFLFQLTNDEMQQLNSVFERKDINRNTPASYLFFALELKPGEYRQTQLAQITRALNHPQVFPMHVFLLFKYGDKLSFSLIDRRANKRFESRDVLEKVTLLHNVSLSQPHPGHVQILQSFSLEEIVGDTPKSGSLNFDDVQNGWRKVLDTQVLNSQFYRDYQTLSRTLIQQIHPVQIQHKTHAHQSVLNLLNRLMFLYFLQEKQWLLGDCKFMIHFWNEYRKKYPNGNPASETGFHQHWLNPLFFNAFNGKATQNPQELDHFPDAYRSGVLNFPYLNGGLFTQHSEYDHFLLTDDAFKAIFNFLESYIFTIHEEQSPLDATLAINPRLLGEMYEGMINATDIQDEAAEKGIVYTETPEINFMTRRSLMEVLWQKKDLPEFANLAKLDREFFYHFIFDPAEEKQNWLNRFQVDTGQLREAVSTVTVCDPACGSGSMLVGMIQLQMELLRALDPLEQTPFSFESDFKLKKQLISNCLYGVDVKEWAIRIAELRLWLYMISEAEFSEAQRTQAPLLPNLDFNLRTGNSLLPKFGSIDFDIKSILKACKERKVPTGELLEYIQVKKQFVQNQLRNTQFESIKKQEIKIFQHLIDELIKSIENEIQGMNPRDKRRQNELFSENRYRLNKNDLFENERQKLVKEIDHFRELKKSIHQNESLPFSYDLDFMEIFLIPDDPGFDLIVGNPPYVRQEDILPQDDPEELERLLLEENKDEKAGVSKSYKEQLNERVYELYPFLKETAKTEVKQKRKEIAIYGNKVPGRSDLYVYFQLLCPNYLNSKGTFCFIISNSWLDVEFGAFVQQFLLKHTRLHAIYDCTVRSFSASVNTIIYLHSALIHAKEYDAETKTKINFKALQPPENQVQFVMNHLGYLDTASAPLLLAQERCQENTFAEAFRVIPMTQKQLFQAGFNEEEKQFTGDKWGGKYLRAPEIYYKILEKGKGKFVRLGDIAEVRFGIKTGANEFFYLPNKFFDLQDKGATYKLIPREKELPVGMEIEKEFLRKTLISPKQTDSLSLKSFNSYAFYIQKNAKNTKAFDYIKFGERQGFNKVPSVRGRTYWYSLNQDENIHFVSLRFFGERIFFIKNERNLIGDTFFVGTFKNKMKSDSLFLSLNSTISLFNVELLGRKNMGDGVLLFYGPEINNHQIIDITIQIDKRLKDKFYNRKILTIFEELGFDKTRPIRSQHPNPLPDRKALDDIIFDELDLSPEERNEVYWAVAELVQQRLNKAASRKTKHATPRQETPLERQVWPSEPVQSLSRKPRQPIRTVREDEKVA